MSAASASSLLLPQNYRAVVLGATGAIGRELVAHLAASKRCGTVVAVTRRQIDEGEFPTVFPNLAVPGDAKKVEIAVVDFERLCSNFLDASGKNLKQAKPKAKKVERDSKEESADSDDQEGDSSSSKEADEGEGAVVFAGAHLVASCLGTSPWSKRVDVDYANAGAQAARAGGTVAQFSLVTSEGASSSSFIGYLKAKGQAEDDARAMKFSRLSLVRPGALDRGQLRKARTKERILGFFGMKGISVSVVARGMVADAEQAEMTGDDREEPRSSEVILTNAGLQRLAKEAESGAAAESGAEEKGKGKKSSPSKKDSAKDEKTLKAESKKSDTSGSSDSDDDDAKPDSKKSSE